jgi:hypothetical protein
MIKNQDFDEKEELISDNPTPMLLAWAKDANEFGIPYDVQKGLIFFIAFALRTECKNYSDQMDWVRFTRKLSKKIRLKSPHIRDDDGGEFYDYEFSPLLTELAEKTLGSAFSPRKISSQGRTYCIWDREGKPDQLPAWGGKLMTTCSDIVTALCKRFGEKIDMDLEGAYLAGFLYFDSCYPMDNYATYQIAELINELLPPKYMWFRHMLKFDARLIGQGNPMQKILDCFLAGIPQQAPTLYRLTCYLSDQLHYQSVGVKRQEVWEVPTRIFAEIVVNQSQYFDFQAPKNQEALKAAKEFLNSDGLQAPKECLNLTEATELVVSYITRWGYTLEDKNTEIIADLWTKRCCILYTCVAFSVLLPSWNKF